MDSRRRSWMLAALCFSWALSAGAQTVVDPSGHWEGSIQVPNHELKFEIDVAKNDNGVLAGTFSSADQHIKGLPLSKLSIEGTSIAFQVVRPDQPFAGVISADGKSIAGTLTAEGQSIAFNLTRTGDAKIAPPARSAPIGKDLEGTWNGTLAVNGKDMRVVAKMSNLPDGTSMGSIANLDQGGVEIPITTITQKASAVTLTVDAVSGSYEGTLKSDGTELAGTWTQGPLVVPLTFRRAGGTETKK
jgi:hypothetical protein